MADKTNVYICMCMTITLPVTLPVKLDSTLTVYACRIVQTSMKADLKRLHTTLCVIESCTLLCVWLKVAHYSACDCTLLCV